jgi:serine/threonine protein kinase
MAAPQSTDDLLELIRLSKLLDDATFKTLRDQNRTLPSEPARAAEVLIRRGLLTPLHVHNLLAGKYRGFFVGPYKVLRLLGTGGMGKVFLAEHTGMQRKVALKTLSDKPTNKEIDLARFQREARSAAALDHPNIVRLYDIGSASGVHYLVMEYVEGQTLHDSLKENGPLPYREAVDVVCQAAAGLAHAHERGFVHRDIKPSNLIRGRDGSVKILDMGLARSFENPNDNLTEQLDDSVVGTVDYIAPEQAVRLQPDARSDIYSLGATFYYLLAGEPPFGGTTAQKLLAHQMQPPPSLTGLGKTVPPGLNDVLAKMMAKKPDDRYQSADELIEALDAWYRPAPQPTPSRRIPSSRRLPAATARPPQPKKPTGRWAEASVAAGVAAVVVVGGALWLMGGSKKARVQSDQPVVAAAPSPSPSASPSHATPTAPPKSAPDAPTKTTAPAPASQPTAGRSVFRLDLTDIKPFTQRFRGRTDGAVPPDFMGPAGWSTHSWQDDCTHEFFCDVVDGQKVLGVRVVEGPAGGKKPGVMLVLRRIPVVTNHEYTLRVVYRTEGGNVGDNIRVREDPPASHMRYQGRLTQTYGKWSEVTPKFRCGPTNTIQLELFHVGPVGEGHELYVREVELIELD